MKLYPSRSLALAVAALAWSQLAAVAQAEPIVKDGDVIAICGDSITEQKQYSVYMEAYLHACQPADVKVVQFGWSGETASGFLNRMKSDVLPIKPTLATLCYGMNDGRYREISDEIRKAYRDPMAKIVENFQAAGTRVIVGSPGVVDVDSFKRPSATPEVYNQNLAALGAEGKQIADANGQVFADVHTAMMNAMVAAKKELGEKYHVAGGDGVHPSSNGQLVMAYAFLKSMGFEGDLGTISIDLAQNSATAVGGHKVTSSEPGTVTIESTTYPFCFGGTDPKNPGHSSSIVPYVPFNQDLNRLVLKAAGGQAPKYKVTWGEHAGEFTAEQLAAGINLAAEFPQNPFSAPFNVLERAIREKQAFETRFFKQITRTVNEIRPVLKDDDAAVQGFLDACRKHHDKLTATVESAKVPVTHTIRIEAVQ